MEKVLMSTNFIKAIDQTFYGFTSVITHDLQSVHLNGHIIGFFPQTQKLVPSQNSINHPFWQ